MCILWIKPHQIAFQCPQKCDFEWFSVSLQLYSCPFALSHCFPSLYTHFSIIIIALFRNSGWYMDTYNKRFLNNFIPKSNWFSFHHVTDKYFFFSYITVGSTLHSSLCFFLHAVFLAIKHTLPIYLWTSSILFSLYTKCTLHTW